MDYSFMVEERPALHAPILVLGLGNPLLGDDSVGWRVAARVARFLEETPQVLQGKCEVDAVSIGGLGLMERLIGYEQAVLIDAVVTGMWQTGDVHCYRLDEGGDLAAGHLICAHDTSLTAALTLGRSLGVALPTQLLVVGIESRRVYDFSETLTPAVARALPKASRLVVGLVRQLAQGAPVELTAAPCFLRRSHRGNAEADSGKASVL